MSTIHRRWSHSSALANLVLSIPIVLLLAACGGGSSDPPIAGALVPGQGPVGQSPGNVDLTQVTVRSGSEVALNGENSDGIAYPVASAQWRQTDSTGVVVPLDKRTELTRAFRVPNVDAPTKLTFALSVTNRGGQTSTKSVEVNIVPVGDSNQFLDFFTTLEGNYTVVAALASGVTATSDVAFTITQRQLVNYADRASQSKEPNQFDVEIGKPTVASSSWLENTTATWTTIDEAVKAYYHPNLSFVIPKLDTDDINILFDDTDPKRGIDDFKRDTVQHFVDLTLQVTSGSCANANGPVDCQSSAILYVLKSNSAPVDQFVVGSDPAHRVVAVDVLKAVNSSSSEKAAPESALTAEKYYAAVDPANKRTSLTDWLKNSGFTNSTGGLINEGEIAHALYVNNYDLGFTRDMFVRKDPSGNVYAYVTNFPALRPAIVRSTDPDHRDDDVLATVAMEFASPDQDLNAARIVKFFVFVPDGTGEQPRVNSLNFDGRGEKWVPGACLACHGGTSQSLVQSQDGSLVYPDNGNVDAAFLPWDLDSFLYVAAKDPKLVDPVVTEAFKINSGYLTQDQLNRFSRENQDSTFRKMNQAALATMDPAAVDNAASPTRNRFPVVRGLIHGWYGEETDTGNELPAVAFNGTFIQHGWRASEPANANVDGLESFYGEVFSRHCRVCHSQAKKINQFASYNDFLAKRSLIQQYVFQDGRMPNARLDLDRIWVDFHGGAAAAPRIAKILGLDDASPPGRPVARIAGPTVITLAPVTAMASIAPLVATLEANNRDSVRIDATGSSFVEQFHWTLTPPSGSHAQLTGADTALPAFFADQPGIYTISLVGSRTLSTGEVLQSESISRTVDATPLNPKNAADNQLTGVPESTPDVKSVVTIDRSHLRWKDEDTPDAELEFTVTSPPKLGTLKLGTLSTMSFTQADINAGLLTYTQDPDKPASPLQDGFDYVVSDGTGNFPAIGGTHFTIILTEQNDRPLERNNGPLRIDERTSALITNALLQWTDEDPNQSAGILYTVATLPSHGTLLVNGCPLSAGTPQQNGCPSNNLSFLQDDVDRGQLSYVHDGISVPVGQGQQTDNFVYTVTDAQDAGRAHPFPSDAPFKIIIQQINERPRLSVHNIALQAGRDLPLSATLSTTATGVPVPPPVIAVVDPDTAADKISLTLSSAPARGKIVTRTCAPATNGSPPCVPPAVNLDVTVGQSQSFSLADAIAGKIYYVHTSGPYDTSPDAFAVTVDDGAVPPPPSPDTGTIRVTVNARTDGPQLAALKGATLSGYLDTNPAVSRDGSTRTSTLEADVPWASHTITAAELSFTNPNPGLEAGECSIKYILKTLPASGDLIVAGSKLSPTDPTLEFTQAQVDQNLVVYENKVIGNLQDSFTFVASNCVLINPAPPAVPAQHTFAIKRELAPTTDIGWVIDTQWSDAENYSLPDCGAPLACRDCHAADSSRPNSSCPFVSSHAWTVTQIPGGTLDFCALITAYSNTAYTTFLAPDGNLPNLPARSDGPMRAIFSVGSFPNLMLQQWKIEGLTHPGTCPP